MKFKFFSRTRNIYLFKASNSLSTQLVCSIKRLTCKGLQKHSSMLEYIKRKWKFSLFILVGHDIRTLMPYILCGWLSTCTDMHTGKRDMTYHFPKSRSWIPVRVFCHDIVLRFNIIDNLQHAIIFLDIGWYYKPWVWPTHTSQTRPVS